MHKIKLSKQAKADLNNWQLYLFILPALIYFILFHYIPMYGVQIAFKSFIPAKGIWGSKWVGLMHFRNFFNSFYFKRLIVNTLAINLYSLLAGFPMPIILALMLNEVDSRIYKKSVQFVTYAPYFISTVVIVGMLNIFLNQDRGLVNNLLEVIGLNRVNFMNSARWFKTVYVFSGIWQGTGFGAIVYLGVLSGVDPNLHEAAVIDGASRMQRVIYINIPVIKPTAIVLFILNCGSLFSMGFEKILLMQNPINASASEVIATYTYRLGIIGGQYSYTSAIGLFNSICNLMLILLANSLAKRISDTRLM